MKAEYSNDLIQGRRQYDTLVSKIFLQRELEARVAQWIAQQPPKLPGAGSSPAPCITGKATINSYQIQGGIPHESIINYQS